MNNLTNERTTLEVQSNKKCTITEQLQVAWIPKTSVGSRNSQREKRELKSEREKIRKKTTKILSTFLLWVPSLTSEFLCIVLGYIVLADSMTNFFFFFLWLMNNCVRWDAKSFYTLSSIEDFGWTKFILGRAKWKILVVQEDLDRASSKQKLSMDLQSTEALLRKIPRFVSTPYSYSQITPNHSHI